MTNYPTSLDDDATIFRVDDNITEIGSEVINQIRDALFAVEENLGLSPAGSKDSLSERVDVSINSDGTIKASALTSIGLVTLPINNAQVGVNAGIIESKLALDYGTSDLNTLIEANAALLESLSAFFALLEANFNSHVAGGPADNLRHVASHIDINTVPIDTRDSLFTWTGLKDKDGYALDATNVAEALNEINTNFTTHQNQTADAHTAESISVDTSDFQELSRDSINLQQVIDNIDDIEELELGTHRTTEHSNGIPKDARSVTLSTLGNDFDGYNINVVPSTPITAHTAHSPGTSPVDSTTVGDNVISFTPTNSNFIFDSQFSQARIGDVIHINYGNGIADIRKVESIRYVPGTEWIIRVDGTNLRDTDGYADGYLDGYFAFARIDRPLFDQNIYGVLAIGAANATPLASYSNILGSIIIGDPKGATALGIGFNPNQIDANHYNLYLQLYPTGAPDEKTINLPAIDVSGNLGVTPGKYTLETVVQNVNNKFRQIGYNFRFIAFSVDGNFGLMLADSIDGAAFSIISGINTTGSLTVGSYIKNVISNVNADNFDALGFGFNRANISSPAYQNTWIDPTAAQLPTKLIHPVKRRNFIANGKLLNGFKKKPLTTDEGYWAAEITARTVTGGSVEVTYRIDQLLTTAGLKVGKTILIQPAVDLTDPLYLDVDYGRFIIKEVIFSNCDCADIFTSITVINGLHGLGTGVGSSSGPGLPIRLFFSEDSVSFDDENIIDSATTGLNYHRLFEIYITDKETTLSHERARLPYQTETLELLNTSFWHINFVSSKLRGYRDTGSSSFKKYVRLYINDYDAVSGEFDGYIGQRNPLNINITRTGPLTKGRKNIPTRFYDETNVDYIELEFTEISTGSPGLTIVPGPRYVDIELFSSELSDDELLPLATCEVNWSPEVGYNIVERIIDRRQRGSISEQEFTQSAVDFITAGERYLHNNGVVRGFEYTGVNSSDNRELFFTGGLALVNGKIIAVNNTSVNIPQVTKVTAPPQTLDWAICVNDTGNLISIPISITKIQFYARDSISTNIYYIPSVSFSELVNDRSDLTLVAIVNVTIASFTVNTISDARKFIIKETNSIPLTLVSDNTLIGHFYNFTQVKQWVKNLGLERNTVKVKGAFSVLEEIDLSDVNNQLTIDGSDGGTFNISSPICFKVVGSTVDQKGITIKNVNFNYNPADLSYIAGDNINSKTNSACIYSEVTTVISANSIIIDNCSFITSIATQRPPYILFNIEDGATVSDVKIFNNTFNDLGNIVNSEQCAIGFITSSVGLSKAILSNVKIRDNICNQRQSIIITPGTDNGQNQYGKIFCHNVLIENNTCGIIGFLTSSRQATIERFGVNCLNIIGNTCLYIGVIYPDGRSLFTFGQAVSVNSATGNVNIERNNCMTIQPAHSDDAVYFPNLTISHNTIQVPNSSTYTALDDLGFFGVPFHYDYGIYCRIYSADGATGKSYVEINGNKIIQNSNGGSGGDLFTHGIFVESGNSEIYNNRIEGFDGYGIYIRNEVAGTTNHIVKANKIYRGSTNISSYITNNLSTFNTTAIVTENDFDSTTINGSNSSSVILVSPTYENWTVQNNRNQKVTLTLDGYTNISLLGLGNFTMDGLSYATQTLGDFTGGNSIIYIQPNTPHSIMFRYTNSGALGHFGWNINLLQLLPNNVYITNISLDILSSVNPSTAGGALLGLYSGGFLIADFLDFTISTFGILSVDPPASGYKVNGLNSPSLNLAVTMHHSTLTAVFIKSLAITYRY